VWLLARPVAEAALARERHFESDKFIAEGNVVLGVAFCALNTLGSSEKFPIGTLNIVGRFRSPISGVMRLTQGIHFGARGVSAFDSLDNFGPRTHEVTDTNLSIF
jgi:hypothetical protein